MHNIKVSLTGYLNGAIILVGFGLISLAIGVSFFAGMCFGAALVQLSISYLCFHSRKTVQLNIPEETKRVLEILATEAGLTLEEYVKWVLDNELKGKEMKAIITPVSRDIVEKLQRASGLTNKNAEK